jgi:hypothetical protein
MVNPERIRHVIVDEHCWQFSVARSPSRRAEA